MLEVITILIALIFFYTQIEILIQLGLFLVGLNVFIFFISMFNESLDEIKYKIVDLMRSIKSGKSKLNITTETAYTAILATSIIQIFLLVLINIELYSILGIYGGLLFSLYAVAFTKYQEDLLTVIKKEI